MTKTKHKRIASARKSEPFASHKRIAQLTGGTVADSKEYSRWLAHQKKKLGFQRARNRPKGFVSEHRKTTTERMPVGSTVHCDADDYTGVVTEIIGTLFVVDGGARKYYAKDIYPIPSATQYRRLKADFKAAHIAKKRAEEARYPDTYERETHGHGYRRAGRAGGAG